MTGSLLSLANRLKSWSPNQMWLELKREISIQYSAIPYDSHTTQAFELFDIYFDCACEFLSKNYHTSVMSRILAEGLNHYTVVYDLNCRRLKYSVVGNQGAQWRVMEDCFRDICNIDAWYEKVKGYCSAKYNAPEASAITEAKTMREPRLCYKCGGLHFQSNCTNLKKSNSNIFQNKTTKQQNYKGNNYTNKFCDNKGNMFLKGTMSFQASQQIRPSDDILVNIDSIKCFIGKRGEK